LIDVELFRLGFGALSALFLLLIVLRLHLSILEGFAARAESRDSAEAAARSEAQGPGEH
jgi:hypothetical protein